MFHIKCLKFNSQFLVIFLLDEFNNHRDMDTNMLLPA